MVNVVRLDSKVDRNAIFRIYIDKFNVGTLMNEEKKSFNLKEGKHTIQIKYDKHKSKEISFDIATGETMEFQCIPKYKDNLLSKLAGSFTNDIDLVLKGDYFI